VRLSRECSAELEQARVIVENAGQESGPDNGGEA
jgi:exonuclease VII small subunit